MITTEVWWDVIRLESSSQDFQVAVQRTCGIKSSRHVDMMFGKSSQKQNDRG